ncbi:MAG: hypothetical protein JO152_09080, partial [Mycobacteriaceae bacterium]|nr:hypothetical protein [Mycobacteriaceae bacterium]
MSSPASRIVTKGTRSTKGLAANIAVAGVLAVGAAVASSATAAADPPPPGPVDPGPTPAPPTGFLSGALSAVNQTMAPGDGNTSSTSFLPGSAFDGSATGP